MTNNAHQLKDSTLALLEKHLSTYLPKDSSPVVEAMAYSLLGGGKRVRGLLTLKIYQLFGGQNLEQAVAFAASVEMIHAYSLIHDDLPCMDDDDLRRGQPSCHIAFGEATALLAGDALLTLAFEVLAHNQHQKYFTNEQILSCISLLATSSGTKGMIGGQVMDLANENQSVTGELLEKTDLLKTGALITAAALMGSILGGASEEEQALVQIYGQKIGLAFQIIDDILDKTSTEDILGKPIESDLQNKKSTYVSLYGLDKADRMAQNLTSEALAALDGLGKASSFLRGFTLELAQRDY